MTSRNYVQVVLDELRRRLPGCPDDLLELYALLALNPDSEATLEQVHNAWSIWQNRTRPDHRSLISFLELDDRVRELDRKYADAINEVAAALR